MTSLEQARKIVQVMDSKKAKDIRLIKIEGISSLGDYFVVASASNTTQVKAIADEVEDEMTKLGLEPNRVEGRQSAQWTMMLWSTSFWTKHAAFTIWKDCGATRRSWTSAIC